ncbi:MAG: Gfo/Idh/MocA family oxidoreductase [Ignavibacteria bacterium]|nr:Gfo/Idh/MocA family oxidoreductase [Ignavibacteria bacterium]
MKIAIIGLGYWGSNIVRIFNQLADVNKTFLYDIDENKIYKHLRTNPNNEKVSSLQEIVDRGVDAVVISTPPSTHFELTKYFLEKKINVLVEKPLALNVEDAKSLIAISKENNVKLMVDHTFVYNDAVRKIKEIISNGELGDLLYLFSERLNLGIVRNDVNVWWNLAPHDLSVLQFLLESNPTVVKAQGMFYLQDGIEDIVISNLLYPDKIFATIFVSWLHPLKVRRLTIVGTKKMLIYDDVSTDAKIMIFNKGFEKLFPKELPPIENFGHFQLLQRNGDVVIPYFEFREPLKVMANHFVDCLKNNKEPITNGENALKIVKILCKVDKLLKNGKG